MYVKTNLSLSKSDYILFRCVNYLTLLQKQDIILNHSNCVFPLQLFNLK